MQTYLSDWLKYISMLAFIVRYKCKFNPTLIHHSGIIIHRKIKTDYNIIIICSGTKQGNLCLVKYILNLNQELLEQD